MVVYITNYVDTEEVISIRSASEDKAVNIKNNDATVIGFLDSYFSNLTVMIPLLLWIPLMSSLMLADIFFSTGPFQVYHHCCGYP